MPQPAPVRRSPHSRVAATFTILAAISLTAVLQTPVEAAGSSTIAAASPLSVVAPVGNTPPADHQGAPSPTSIQSSTATPSAATPPTATPPTATPPTATPPTATPEPPAPPDPLAGLSKKDRKAFTACLGQRVDAHSSGSCARLLLTRLKQAGYYHPTVTSSIGVAGANALLNYQRSRGLVATGTSTEQTWLALAAKAKQLDAQLPAKCLGAGVNLCVNQGQRKLYFLRDGKVIRTFKVRLGGYNVHPKTHKWRVFPTANGSWRVFDKQVNPKSDNYGSGAMPYSVMFHPDMYVHYSPGFHADGYAKSSHGCVNIGQLSEAIWIYQHTPIGARVTVFTPKA